MYLWMHFIEHNHTYIYIGWSPAEAKLLLVAPENRGSCFYCSFRQHVMQDDHLNDRLRGNGSDGCDAARIPHGSLGLTRAKVHHMYLVFSTIANHHEHCPVLQGDPFSIWTRIRLSIFFRNVAIFLALKRKIKVDMSFMTWITENSRRE